MVGETENASHPETLIVPIKLPRMENGVIIVSVINTGAGLPPPHREQISNEFLATRLRGTGMGLAICLLVRSCPRGAKISDTHRSRSPS
jgi:nitrogen fixation/metabolism regulation signal transduction histidine kinase